MQQSAQSAGAEFIFNQKVTDIKCNYSDFEDGRKTVDSVKTDGGLQLSAKVVVNAAGPWSPRINQLAFKNSYNDMKITTKPMRQEVAYVPAPPGVDYNKDGLIVPDFEAGVYSV